MQGPAVTVSLSGGGYRAAAFSAGALLALSDSALRPHVVSISSVSGGSLASALTVGGFAPPEPDDPDPMYSRVRRVGGMVRSKLIFTETLAAFGRYAYTWPLFFGAFFFFAPEFALSWDPVETARVVLFFVGLSLLTLASAIPQSLYGVQSAVESLTARSLGGTDAATGPTLAEAGSRDPVRRIFCATDLAGGSHVYLSPRVALGPGLEGRRPKLLLADVVAASAGFPGFRPLGFKAAELGAGSGEADGTRPRPRRIAGRFAIGALGVCALFVAVAAIVLRLVGVLGGVTGLAVALGGVGAGLAVAYVSGLRLKRSRDVWLVDGGVYDNLGAAFALLTSDRRYPALADELDVGDGGLLFVVDASKDLPVLDPNKGSPLGALIPWRLRAASRSVLQLGRNANSVARKAVIEMLLARNDPFAGAVISIGDKPTDAEDGIDWEAVAAANAETQTTLNALPDEAARNLILQGYRLMEGALAKHGYAMQRHRAIDEFDALAAEPQSEDAKGQWEVSERAGPYGRRDHAVRRVSFMACVCLTIVLVTIPGLLSS